MDAELRQHSEEQHSEGLNSDADEEIRELGEDADEWIMDEYHEDEAWRPTVVAVTIESFCFECFVHLSRLAFLLTCMSARGGAPSCG